MGLWIYGFAFKKLTDCGNRGCANLQVDFSFSQQNDGPESQQVRSISDYWAKSDICVNSDKALFLLTATTKKKKKKSVYFCTDKPRKSA